jgi:hypothetical protein
VMVKESIKMLRGLDALEALDGVLGTIKEEYYDQNAFINSKSWGSIYRVLGGGTSLKSNMQKYLFEGGDCHTIGCAAGWASAIWEDVEEEGCEAFFGITRGESGYLFGVSHVGNVGVDQALRARRRIREVLKNHGRELGDL